ncbi:hypothetical protein lerEdw1_005302 [Lerista edwardsae]|nr:hypothetical protein lerEdw1_005302 [Lerista edwardsae]
MLLEEDEERFWQLKTLEIKTDTQVTAFLNRDAVLQCNISQYSTLNIKKIAVIWYLETTTGGNDRRPVYSVIAGEHTSYRNGSQMDENNLKKGRAVLFLPQIQLNESGTYVCYVAVTPSKAEGTTILEVVGQPVIILSPEEVTVERDKEKTLSCIVNEFYPNLIVVQWEKNSKHSPDKSVPAEDICTGSSVENEDGTFNITSKLKLQPSLQDDGNVYSCIVKHKSFPMEPIFSVTLTVTEPKENVGWIPALLILIGLIFVIGFVVVYHRRFKKPLPLLDQIHCSADVPQPEELLTFTCRIHSYFPEALEIHWYKDDEPILEQFFVKYPTKGPDGLFSCISCIIYRLKAGDIAKRFFCKANLKGSQECKASAWEMKYRALPMMDEVQCSTDEPSFGTPLHIYCRIHSFFPPTIEVHWYKEGDPIPEKPFVSDPTKGHDGLFSCITSMVYLPKAGDVGKKFICKANLKGSQECEESVWEMKTLVFIPKVSPVECEPREPEFGKPITLFCVVRDFYPPECDICWKKGLKELTYATVKTGDPEQAPASNLYHRKSQVSFTPRPEDHAEDVVVEIKHCNRIIQNKYPLMLKGFPRVADIFIDPSNAEYGNTLSLTCEVMDFCPRGIRVQWLDGDNLIRNGVVTEEPVEDSNGSFKLSSRFQLVPTALDYDKTISFMVRHEKLTKPITKSVSLKLPAIPPDVSEIIQCQHGGITSLEISVSNFAPRDIRVVWYKGWKKISEDANPYICIAENKLCCFTSGICCLKETDIKKSFECTVFHPATKTIQEKSFVLKNGGHKNLHLLD